MTNRSEDGIGDCKKGLYGSCWGKNIKKKQCGKKRWKDPWAWVQIQRSVSCVAGLIDFGCAFTLKALSAHLLHRRVLLSKRFSRVQTLTISSIKFPGTNRAPGENQWLENAISCVSAFFSGTNC